MNPSIKKYGFATYITEDGQYSFQFNDKTGRPVLYGREYQFQKSRDRGLKTLIRNARKEGQYEAQQHEKGWFYFILKGGNQQEIGRSIPFETEAEMEEIMALLQGITNNVPIFDLAERAEEDSVEKVESKVEEKETEAAREIAKENPGKEPAVEKLPRYKFSIIYYPDSEVWAIKHDQSGNAKQFKTCDGKQIEAFLKAHLPEKATPTATNPVTVQPKVPMPTGIARKTAKATGQEIELKLRSVRGEEIQHFTKAHNLAQLEVMPKKGQAISPAAFEATVTAKPMEGPEIVVVTEVKEQKPKYGCFLIPIHEASKLKPGMYRFSVTIHQGAGGEEAQDYQGSRMLMLN